jgi:hypothetical protein
MLEVAKPVPGFSQRLRRFASKLSRKAHDVRFRLHRPTRLSMARRSDEFVMTPISRARDGGDSGRAFLLTIEKDQNA